MAILSHDVALKINQTYQYLLDHKKLRTKDQINKEYALFRDNFGPSVLSGLDGEALLSKIHDLGNRDSLVYWLEFKNDDEFCTTKFGNIGGGSALKYRIFFRRETGTWQTMGGPGNRPKDISTGQAIEIARSHRNQFINGISLLENLKKDALLKDYFELQEKMDKIAPDVSRLDWGHKYFSLFYPDKIDDFHMTSLQQFYLIKMLQNPPQGDGRYICASQLVNASKEVGIIMNHFTTTIQAAYGPRHKYWLIKTKSNNSNIDSWQSMLDNNFISIGFVNFEISGAFSGVHYKNHLDNILLKEYANNAKLATCIRENLINFSAEMDIEDIVLVANEKTVFGIGRLIGGYEFHQDFELPHRRQVEWINTNEWQLPHQEQLLSYSVIDQIKNNENLLSIEQMNQSSNLSKPKGKVGQTPFKRPLRLTGVPGRIQSVLERKSQVILYGPPGTGKTYWAESTAQELASLSGFGKSFGELNESERVTVVGNGSMPGLVRVCCFHPAYGYEDFLEGYRPKTVNGQVSFELRDGVFKKLCKDASALADRNFYLIVDEINRGDIPRIFGELLTTLEKDKRGKRIILPVSQEIFSVPPNVFLIGTMNTADRSISLLDAALRRRFGFVELMPDSSVLKDSWVAGIPLKAWLDALNARIRDHVGRDARNLQIGHSYLMHGNGPIKDLATLKRALRDDIIPLLEEYCYEDYANLGTILGEQIVDVAGLRVRHELFEDGQEDALIPGMLAPFLDIPTSTEALLSDEAQAAADEDEEDQQS